MNHGICKEHQVHASSPDALVVKVQEHIQPVPQAREWGDRLIHLGHVKVSFLWLLPCSNSKAQYHSQQASTGGNDCGLVVPIHGWLVQKQAWFLSRKRTFMELFHWPKQPCCTTNKCFSISNKVTSTRAVTALLYRGLKVEHSWDDSVITAWKTQKSINGLLSVKAEDIFEREFCKTLTNLYLMLWETWRSTWPSLTL